MRRAWLRGLVCLGVVLLGGAIAASGSPGPARCGAEDGWRFVCGVPAAEDLVAVPGTHWLVASALNLGRPAPLALVDTRSNTAQPLAASIAAAAPDAPDLPPGCPGPPDFGRMSTDGLALRAERDGVDTLYAANHGDRRAIEIFRLDVRVARPTLAWAGCAITPPGTLPNAVAALPNHGFIAVSFHNPDDPAAWDRMRRGEDTGRLFARHPGQGRLEPLPVDGLSGGNGVAVTPDGLTAYVSAWSARRLLIVPLDGGRERRIALDFMPDNVHLLRDGSLLIAGQRTSVAAIARCHGSACPQPWVVARVDPRRGAVAPVAAGRGSPRINYACGALVVGKTVYMTSRGAGGIAYRAVLSLPGEARLSGAAD